MLLGFPKAAESFCMTTIACHENLGMVVNGDTNCFYYFYVFKTASPLRQGKHFLFVMVSEIYAVFNLPISGLDVRVHSGIIITSDFASYLFHTSLSFNHKSV